MSSVQKAELLAQTLAHNHLPPVNSPVENTLANVVGTVSQGESLVSSLITSLMGSGEDKVNTNTNDHVDHIPGLPVPGTLQHTITLALFRAQQTLAQVLQPSQGVDKIGLAEGQSDNGSGGMLGGVSSAASSLVKFLSPPSSSDTSDSSKPGVTYSQVTSGPDPAYAALGLLTTGAIGTVIYSYVASDDNLASSATAFAKGAVDAIKRNDLVQAATSALSSVTGNKFDNQPDPGNLNYGSDYNEYSEYEYLYHDREDGENFDYSYADPYRDYREYSDPYNVPENTQWSANGVKDASDVQYISYKEEQNPWDVLRTKGSTDHLYQ